MNHIQGALLSPRVHGQTIFGVVRVNASLDRVPYISVITLTAVRGVTMIHTHTTPLPHNEDTDRARYTCLSLTQPSVFFFFALPGHSPFILSRRLSGGPSRTTRRRRDLSGTSPRPGWGPSGSSPGSRAAASGCPPAPGPCLSWPVSFANVVFRG